MPEKDRHESQMTRSPHSMLSYRGDTVRMRQVQTVRSTPISDQVANDSNNQQQNRLFMPSHQHAPAAGERRVSTSNRVDGGDQAEQHTGDTSMRLLENTSC